jgi:multiple sugar transport system substrate-binding protein
MRPDAQAVVQAGARPVTRRRLLTRASLTGGSAAVLAACGGPTAQQTTLAKDTKANLVWFIWSSNNGVRGDAYNAITHHYQQEFPNVTVEQISGGGNLKTVMEKLMTMVSADQPIDVLGVRHDVLGQYVTLGLMKDLGPLLKRDQSVKLAEHMPSAVEMLSFKSKQYALPIGLSTSAMAYNADLFAKAGVPVPTDAWDWKQFVETAQRLTKRQDESPIWGAHILPSSSELFYWTWMNGGEPFSPKEEPTKATFSQAETLETVQWLTDLTTRYGVKAPFDHPDGKGNNGKFAEGRVAMFPVQSNNTRELQDLPFKWDIVALPKGKKGTVYPLSSFSYGIHSKTKHEELTWKLWALATGQTGQREWMTKTGEFMPSHKALQSEYERVPLKPANRKLFIQAATGGRPTPKATRWGDMSPIIDEHLQAADTGKMSVKAALESLDRQLIPFLAQ